MSNSACLFRASIAALKSSSAAAVNPSSIEIHHRNLAEGFNRIFSSFAVEICGCENPADRVHLKKAVWQQTVGMKLGSFLTSDNTATTVFVERLAKMDCPLYMYPKSSEESSPSKIILASKLLRSHFGLNESTTCRGCPKRGRCPFAHKTVTNKNTKTSLGALIKVLFGIAQSCRLHLTDPEKYQFTMSVDDMEAAANLVETLETFLKPAALERQLRNIPVADRNAVRAIVKKQLKKKESVENEIKRERKEKIPDWMRKRIGDPLLDEVKVTSIDSKPRERKPKFDIDANDWVAEEKEEEYSRPNLQFDESLLAVKVERESNKSNETSLDSLADIPIVKRFSKFDQIFTKRKLRRNETGEEIKIGSEPNLPSGGYKMDSGKEDNHVIEGVEYIKSHQLKGRTVLDNVSVASKLWGNGDPWITELKFLQRVPYTESVPEQHRVTEDTVLRSALDTQVGFSVGNEAGSRKESVAPATDLFHEFYGKKRMPNRIALIDKRFDYNDGRSDGIGDMTNCEIVTGGNVTGKSIREFEPVDNGRAEALRLSLGPAKKLIETETYFETTSSRMRFPKFPEQEFKSPKVVKSHEPGMGPRSRGGVDISLLMRPSLGK